MAWVGRPVTSRPARVIRPRRGGVSETMLRSVVVFPVTGLGRSYRLKYLYATATRTRRDIQR
jgi:hypothetical protein